jgi:hypothetical protein
MARIRIRATLLPVAVLGRTGYSLLLHRNFIGLHACPRGGAELSRVVSWPSYMEDHVETPISRQKKENSASGNDGRMRSGQSTDGSEASEFWTALSVFLVALTAAIILVRTADNVRHPAANDMPAAQTAAIELPPLHVHVEGVDP